VSLLPLFPLPTVVLFPGMLLPLHVFEPRYRALVGDVMATDRRLGMVLLRPGWGLTYEGNPPMYDVACSSEIVHSVPLNDGRYIIALRGLERVRIVDEDYARPYRRANIEFIPDARMNDEDRQAVDALRQTLMGSVPGTSASADMGREEFIHTLAQELNLTPIEKQALLESPSLRARAQMLVELLEMKQAESRLPGDAGWHH
jgi:Lon protease-like protein